jgi:hypothetical protein
VNAAGLDICSWFRFMIPFNNERGSRAERLIPALPTFIRKFFPILPSSDVKVEEVYSRPEKIFY